MTGAKLIKKMMTKGVLDLGFEGVAPCCGAFTGEFICFITFYRYSIFQY